MTARLVCGWGHNDSPVGYIVSDCPFYKTWYRMLQRRQNLGDRPCYRDVTVCEEWKIFLGIQGVDAEEGLGREGSGQRHSDSWK